MLISLLVLLLLFSNALTIRRDKTILFSRIVITSFILKTLLSYNNLYIKALERGILIYGGLLNITTLIQTFNIFFFISSVILTLTGFYPKKIYVNKLSTIYNLLLPFSIAISLIISIYIVNPNHYLFKSCVIE